MRFDDRHMSTHTTESAIEANKRLVDRFIQELFTEGDLAAIERYLSPDFVDHDPPFRGAPEGADGLRQSAVMFRHALPDWRSDTERLIAEGDYVVESFTASGTHRGELLGVAPTGKPLVLKGINVFRVRDGRITERWGRLDDAGLMRQLGLLPG